MVKAYEELDVNLLDKSRKEDWNDGTTALTALLTFVEDENSIAKIDPRSKKNSKSLDEKSNPKEKINKNKTSFEDNLIEKKTGKKMKLFFANAGDCRAICVFANGNALQCTTDHTPSNHSERNRIYDAGGDIEFGRIEGKLSVSRGFGDRQFKEPKALVSSYPDVFSIEVDQNFKFAVLACDGLWGWLNSYKVCKFVNEQLQQGIKPENVCKNLVKYAYNSGSTDNITVILLYFTFNPLTNYYNDSLKEDESSVFIPVINKSFNFQRDSNPSQIVMIENNNEIQKLMKTHICMRSFLYLDNHEFDSSSKSTEDSNSKTDLRISFEDLGSKNDRKSFPNKLGQPVVVDKKLKNDRKSFPNKLGQVKTKSTKKTRISNSTDAIIKSDTKNNHKQSSSLDQHSKNVLNHESDRKNLTKKSQLSSTKIIETNDNEDSKQQQKIKFSPETNVRKNSKFEAIFTLDDNYVDYQLVPISSYIEKAYCKEKKKRISKKNSS